MSKIEGLQQLEGIDFTRWVGTDDLDAVVSQIKGIKVIIGALGVAGEEGWDNLDYALGYLASALHKTIEDIETMKPHLVYMDTIARHGKGGLLDD